MEGEALILWVGMRFFLGKRASFASATGLENVLDGPPNLEIPGKNRKSLPTEQGFWQSLLEVSDLDQLFVRLIECLHGDLQSPRPVRELYQAGHEHIGGNLVFLAQAGGYFFWKNALRPSSVKWLALVRNSSLGL